MITIKPSLETEKVGNYLEVYGENIIYMAACDGDELLGGAAATPEGEILTVKAVDTSLYDGIIKSFINFFDRRGIKNLFSVNEELFPHFVRARFKNEGDKCTVNTDEFFGNPCKEE